MTPVEFAITPFKKFAEFKGRARRSEYWWYTLLIVVVSIVLSILTADRETGTSMIANIWSLATLVPSIAVGVRRMHDVGKSGWFILIPIYNLILACTEGEKGPNEYGSDPKNNFLEDDINNIGTTI